MSHTALCAQKKCPVEGSFRANADKSQSACDAYCISSGYSGGTASATGSKSMCSFGSKYVKDFSTCSMGYDSKIYKSCNSYISCDCSGGQQTCSDGTPYGECKTSDPPRYCDNGYLIDNCVKCGCPTGYDCETGGENSGSCLGTDPRECSDGTPHGECSPTPPQRCNNGVWVDDCNKCPPCPTGRCQTDGICKQIGQPPHADAGFDHRALEGAEVTLDARGSYDPDGAIVSYVWTENGNPICPAGSMCTKDDYSAGTHTITLTVTDNDGNTDSDEMTLTILGVRPGELRALIDYPKNGQFFDENQQIYFAGAGVKGGAGKLRLLRWMSSIDDNGYIGSGPYFYKKLSPGEHTITLKAFDRYSYATDSVTITVESEEQDNTLPSSWDWSHVVLPHAPPYDPPGANWMTRVKHQGRCGCCAAFGLLGTIEAVYNVEQGNPGLDIDLSEQDLVNCAGTRGCCGVSSIKMLNHIKIDGIPDENYFKYTDSTCSHSIVNKKCECECKYNNPCSNTKCPYSVPLKDSKWVITNYHRMSGGRDEIKKRLTEKGPLFAGMDMSSYRQDWDSMDCKGTLEYDHGIVIVGYDDSGGYWIVKNSWGDSNHPYFKVKYGACLIEGKVYYVEGVKKQ